LRVIKKRRRRSTSRCERATNRSQFENNYFTETCSGTEAGSYVRPIDFVYHSTLGLRVIKRSRRREGNEQRVSVPTPNTTYLGKVSSTEKRYPPRQKSRVERLKAKVEPLLTSVTVEK